MFLGALNLVGAAPPEEVARRAKEAMAAANYNEAAALYQELLKGAPTNSGLRFNVALALHSAGKSSEAIPYLQQVTREQPSFMNAWLILGLAYQKLGKPEGALAPLEHVVRGEPGNRIALLELGDAYLSAGKPLEAAKYFSRLSALEPEKAKPLQGLATAYLACSRQMFEQLNVQAPDSPFTAALLAQTSLDQGQYRRAFALVQKARNAKPAVPDLNQLTRAIYHASNHDDWAQKLETEVAQPVTANCGAGDLACLFMAARYEDVLRAATNSSHPQAYYWRSRTYSKLAESTLRKLSELPESAEWHEVLGEAYRLQGRKEDSIREWRDAVRLAPHDGYAAHGLARALWLHRDYSAAQPLFGQLLKSSPDSPELNYEFGDLLLEQQNVEEALPFLRKAIAAGLQSEAVHGALGRALLKTGNPQEAIPHLQRALPSDVDGSLHHQLGRAWQQAGNQQKAEQYFQQQARIAGRQSQLEPEITPP